MSKEGRFMVYCLEFYKAKKGLTGKQVIELFKQYGVIDYFFSCYEALHTTGTNYIVGSACGSISTSKTFLPCMASPTLRLAVVVVLVTPPFWLHIAVTL